MTKLREALTLWAYTRRRRPGERPIWSEILAEYFWHPSGTPMAADEVAENIDAYRDDMMARVDTVTGELAREEIGLDEWEASMADEIADAWRINYVSGRGGRLHMDSGDWGSIGGDLNFQYERLSNFAREIQSGQMTADQIAARAKMYARAGWKAYQKGRRAAKLAAGYREERRVSPMDHETCADCAHYHEGGWQPIGTYPAPGDECACMSNCRCEIIYRGAADTGRMTARDIDQMFELAKEGGFTYHPSTGEFPSEGLAFSVWKDREHKIPLDDVRKQHFLDYVRNNKDLLLGDERKYLGGWVEEGDLWLDCSVVLPADQFDRVTRLCYEHNQEGFFDLGTFTYYDTQEEFAKLMERSEGQKSRPEKREKRKAAIKMTLSGGIPDPDESPEEADLWAAKMVNVVREMGGLPPLYNEETGELLDEEE